MGYVLATLGVLVVLGISLYNHFDSRDINQLTSSIHNNLLFSGRNKRYGAYAMRNDYARIMLFIVIGIVALFGVLVGTHFGIRPGITKQKEFTEQQLFDTTLLSLTMPPEEQEKTLPPSYTIKSDRGSGGQNEADQEAKEESHEAPSNVQDPVDPQQQPPDDHSKAGNPEPPSKEKTKSKTPASELDQYRDVGSDAVAQAKARAEERKQREEQKRLEAQRRKGQDVKGSKGNEGSVPKNQPMVDWTLNGRTPFENNDYWVRNPGYKCGKGVAGTVVINIKVNSNGNVIDAAPVSTAGLDPCLLENAIEYARKSRFNASSKNVQEGSITYKFQAQ